MPTAAILGQESRWATYPAPVVRVSTGFRVIRDWPVSLTNRSYLKTQSTAVHLFGEPTAAPGFSTGVITPPTWSPFGSPEQWNVPGRTAEGGELLIAPGSGCLAGRIYYLVVVGDVTMPAGATGTTTFNPVLYQNTYSNPTGQPGGIVTQSDIISTFTTPQPLAAGRTASFAILAGLSGAAKNNGLLSCSSVLYVDTAVVEGRSLSSNVTLTPPRQSPIMLSLGVQFGGTVSGTDFFQASLVQFEIQLYS